MIRVLRWASLLAVLVVSSRFEFSAGQAVGLGLFAVAVPVMVDAYAVSAIVAGLDVKAALTLLWVSVTTGAIHAALTKPDGRPDDPAWVAGQIGMAVLIATVTTGVLWRVDLLFHREREARAAAEAAELAAAEQRAAADAERSREQQRADLELERERARIDLDRQRVAAELARVATAPPADPPTRPARPSTRPATRVADPVDEVARALGRARWEASGRTMTATQVAAEIGCTRDAAKSMIYRWGKQPPARTAVGE